jgi:exopolysaccharide/PEP-CTERM locus tyrosine autokinase
MSKIQKALGALKTESEAQENKPRKSRRPYVKRRYVPEDAAVSEVLPEYSITIDLETLRDEGLHPREEDSESINQQFRRIKRPVLSIAFKEEMTGSENPNVIMVSSALPKSGKTFCSINLAMSIARERDVGAVIVDADVLKPNISRALGLEERPGLIDYLVDHTVTIDDILVATDLYGIIVVPAGGRHEEATELLASRRMQEFVHALAERYSSRAIIVDTPPLLLTNEANVLAENMGQIVLVVEAGISTQESVIEAAGLLNSEKPINAILNKSRGVDVGAYGANGYGYYGAGGYGYGKEDG